MTFKPKVQSINITNSIYDLERYTSQQELVDFYKRFGCDGYELMRCPPPISDLMPKSAVSGVHLRYFTTWLDFWRQDEEALLKEFETMERVKQVYGGLDRQVIIDFYRDELEFAASMDAPYVVFHAGDCLSREAWTYDFSRTDEEVVDAVIEIVNAILDGTDYQFDFLMENLWWPGLTFTRPEITKRLLDGVHYPHKGIMLDTGHLMNSNLDITTEEEGAAWILECLEKHGDLVDYVKGMHFNKSVSGSWLKGVLAEKRQVPDDYDQRMSQTYSHVFYIDQHRPFTCPQTRDIIERVKPDYLTYEFITMDLAQHEAYMTEQMEAMKWMNQLRE